MQGHRCPASGVGSASRSTAGCISAIAGGHRCGAQAFASGYQGRSLNEGSVRPYSSGGLAQCDFPVHQHGKEFVPLHMRGHYKNSLPPFCAREDERDSAKSLDLRPIERLLIETESLSRYQHGNIAMPRFKSLFCIATLSVSLSAFALPARAQPAPTQAAAAAPAAQNQLLQPAELQAMVAPIALYSDGLLSKVLMASTATS